MANIRRLNPPGGACGDYLAECLYSEVAEKYDMRVDGSSTDVMYDYTTPAGKTALIAKAVFKIRDSAESGQTFGGIATLTNGCLAQILDADGEEVFDLTGGNPIKSNNNFMCQPGFRRPVLYSDTIGCAQYVINVTWDLDHHGGICLPEGYTFRFTVRDSLVALSDMFGYVHGVLFTNL